MADWEETLSRNLLAASRRLWPAIDGDRAVIAVIPSAAGVLAVVRDRRSGRIAFRLFEESRSGTVYLVPNWISSPGAMDEAVADARQRARLVVA